MKEALELTFIGMSVVFSILGFMTILIYSIGKLFTNTQKSNDLETEELKKVSAEEKEDFEEIVAVISAVLSYEGIKAFKINKISRVDNWYKRSE